MTSKNPYPQFFEDITGQKFINQQWRAWNEGYLARVMDVEKRQDKPSVRSLTGDLEGWELEVTE